MCQILHSSCEITLFTKINKVTTSPVKGEISLPISINFEVLLLSSFSYNLRYMIDVKTEANTWKGTKLIISFINKKGIHVRSNASNVLDLVGWWYVSKNGHVSQSQRVQCYWILDLNLPHKKDITLIKLKKKKKKKEDITSRIPHVGDIHSYTRLTLSNWH